MVDSDRIDNLIAAVPGPETEAAKAAAGCCGGPAPQAAGEPAGGCCVADIEAKAEGKTGCGCGA